VDRTGARGSCTHRAFVRTRRFDGLLLDELTAFDDGLDVPIADDQAAAAGQHQERELARESLTSDRRAPANVKSEHRGRRGREARHPQLFAVAAATPA